MSAKNILQEYVIKIGFSIPKYKTDRAGGQDHSPLWRSTVTVNGNSIYIITSDLFSTKTNAENSVAKLMYNKINAENSVAELMYDKIKNSNHHDLANAIDTLDTNDNISNDNLSNTISFSNTTNNNDINPDSIFIIDESLKHTTFISKLKNDCDIVVMTTKNRDKLDIFPNVLVLKINNFIIDSSIYIGYLLSQNRYKNYIIITDNSSYSIISIKKFRNMISNTIDKFNICLFSNSVDAVTVYNAKYL